MSQSQSAVVEWHDFHNDPTSDVYLKSRDGIRLGASSHRLRAFRSDIPAHGGEREDELTVAHIGVAGSLLPIPSR